MVIFKEEERKLISKFPTAIIISAMQEVSEADFELQSHKHLSRQALGGAVGIIITPSREIVLVERTGMHAGWALPGGTVEKGEDFQEAYEREIIEEIGIQLHKTTLFMLERKEFRSPSGKSLNFLLAIFNSHTNTDSLPKATPDAIREGLVSKKFQAGHLPEKMILGDRNKINLFMDSVPL